MISNAHALILVYKILLLHGGLVDLPCNMTDSTAALQEQIDATPAYGTLSIPTGEYWINAVAGGLHLKSHMTLVMSPGTILRAIPNTTLGYTVLDISGVDDVTVTGGAILGDRKQHVDLGGEWGKCILINEATNITINGTMVADSWGDGIYISDTPAARTDTINLVDVIAENNRRQGVSIVSGSNITITNGEYRATTGTSPAAGIDVEPNDSDGVVNNLTITGAVLSGNDNAGLLVYNVHTGTVENLVVNGVTAIGNSSDGAYIIGVDGVEVRNSVMRDNGADNAYKSGIKIETCSNVTIDGNTIFDQTAGRRGVVISADSTTVEIKNNEICMADCSDAIDDQSGSATTTNNTCCGAAL